MTLPADTALTRLREGNLRFSAGLSTGRFTAEQRASSAEGQKPYAVVVGCSDSRVPVEVVFDAGVGELFVVRTAGHVLAAASVASIRFALESLGTRLVVVLGHEDCGAVAAALAGNAPDWLAPIIDHIDVSSIDAGSAPGDTADALLSAAVDAHVRETVAELRELASHIDLPGERPLIVGASYRLDTGQVHWLETA